MQWPRLILQAKTGLLFLTLNGANRIINLFNIELRHVQNETMLKCTEIMQIGSAALKVASLLAHPVYRTYYALRL